MKFKSYISFFLLSCFSLWQLTVTHTHSHAHKHSDHPHSHLTQTLPQNTPVSIDEDCGICDIYISLAESPQTLQLFIPAASWICSSTDNRPSPLSAWTPNSKNKSPPTV